MLIEHQHSLLNQKLKLSEFFPVRATFTSPSEDRDLASCIGFLKIFHRGSLPFSLSSFQRPGLSHLIFNFVCQRLSVQALLELHSIGWFHKGLRSDNVLVFFNGNDLSTEESSRKAYDIENPYLIGFDSCRPSDGKTPPVVGFTLYANLDRHPERWGRPTGFQRYHDLYSLVSFRIKYFPFSICVNSNRCSRYSSSRSWMQDATSQHGQEADEF